MLTRDQILAATDKRRRKAVPVPEWGGEVYVQELSLADKAAAFAALTAKPDDTRTPAERVADQAVEMILRGVVDANGAPLFTRDDDDYVRRLPDRLTARLTKAIESQGKVSKQEAEELEKN